MFGETELYCFSLNKEVGSSNTDGFFAGFYFPSTLAWILDFQTAVHCNVSMSRNDACHKKTDLKVFVVVIPKEGWPHPSFFWYDTDFLKI